MKIICIGRNYTAHAQELNNDLPQKPVVFLKPDSAILRKNFPFYLPEFSQNIHYECELVLKISKVGRYIQPNFAHRYFDEIALGIDFTARDLQSELKAKGLPWEIAKGFDQSAFVSDFYPKEDYDLNDLNFSMKINNQLVQQGNTKNMIFTVTDIICYVSQFFTLKKGDLIFTGTPAGVGKVATEDVLQGYLEQQQVFDVKVK